MTSDDMELLRQYARHNSEDAFATLVARYLNLVYSVALRQLRDPQLAEEVTQAAFIILAHKAESLGPKTILSAWLCRTAQHVAAHAARTERRRQNRENEAYMQSLFNRPDTDSAAWTHIAPLLDSAMVGLGEKDHTAIVLRYFEGKDLKQVGAALGVSENAAKTRVSRALEKMRKFFAKRGVTLSAAVIAGAVSANSIQAAPAVLAQTVAAAAIAKGAAAPTSTLTLIKGAMKLMAWTKVKTTLIATAVILATGTTTVVIHDVASRPGASRRQVLEDGSVLVLDRIQVGSHLQSEHGAALAQFLGGSIPSNGIHFLGVSLNRPTRQEFGYGDKSWLVAEFSLHGPRAASNALVKPAFRDQFRCVVYGESGIEYVQPIWFEQNADGCYGYIEANRFPRDTPWLGFRLESRADEDHGGPWQKVADLRIKNPVSPTIQPWVAETAPITKAAGGMDFVAGQVTVKTIPYLSNDIWNHVVTVPLEVHSNGIALTNWGAPYVRVEDASGNWDNEFRSCMSYDPRHVWKLEADFEPHAGFADENLATIGLPAGSLTFTTNVMIMNVPVTISRDRNSIEASIPTNNPNLALWFVKAANDAGEISDDVSRPGAGTQFMCPIGLGNFLTRRGDGLHHLWPTKLTFAIVPNIHATFYIQPRLLGEPVKKAGE